MIGTRGSKLALWQANWTRDRLLELGAKVTLQVIKTTGDRIVDVALSEVGGKGLFVKEIEEALLSGQIDLAVHSMKDMPAQLPDGLCLATVPARADPRDAWVWPASHEATAADFPALLAALPQGATVGTSSLRRSAQLTHRRPDLRIVPLRGNVDTRLRKLDEGVDGLTAIVLASAGLARLGLGQRISLPIPTDFMLPAVGQGALAFEARADDHATLELVRRLEHAATRLETTAERAFLARLDGNCQVPIAGHARLDGEVLRFTGLIADPLGRTLLTASDAAKPALAQELGVALAELLLARGGDRLLGAPAP